MDLQYSALLENQLKSDLALQACVAGTLHEFWPWIEANRAPLFPEYTDHGPKHIQAVLRGAESLMSDSARELVTPGDAATLILAVLLHDLAMHVTPDGFLDLVRPQVTRKVMTDFGDRPWPQLWQEFSAEARRFDGRTLVSLFGHTDPVPPPAPDSDPERWTNEQRKLVGEFLRRHHPRLAHEIALWGAPGPEATKLRLQGDVPYIADLAGLVARSHGMPVRGALSYLRRRYDLRAYKGVHAVWLMTLLRVSDYLEIAATRAPEAVLQVTRLRSPYSRGEWNTHHAIRDIRATHDDLESVIVDAEPGDVRTYFRVREWLSGIQAELDASWAVLGEVYGANEELRKLGLSLRRVRSTLDDPETEFFQNIPYAPRQAAFRTADAELLKLLVAPLYGHQPAIGIRELVQNGVDAVREIEEHLRVRGASAAAERAEQTADVVASIDKGADGAWWLTVSDRGIGMTEDVVCDYFLRAGASLRTSDRWRREFEDAEGKSRVLRSGRFGIGALAAFLLGDEVEVSTRHVAASPNRGVTFTASLDTELIELRYAERSVGTTVRCRLNEHTVRRLVPTSVRGAHREDFDPYTNQHPEPDKPDDWDWYCLAQPSVERRLAGTVLEQRYHLPPPGGELPLRWRRMLHADYADIQWSFEDAPPALSVNAIVVPSADFWGTSGLALSSWRRQRELEKGQHYSLRVPRVAVYDADGRFPLNVQRTALATDGTFADALADDCWRDFIAALLVHAPGVPATSAGAWRAFSTVPSDALSNEGARWHGAYGWLPWVHTPTGAMFYDRHLVAIGHEEPVIVAAVDGRTPDLVRHLPGRHPILLANHQGNSSSWLRQLSLWLDVDGRTYGSGERRMRGSPLGLYRVRGCHLLVRNELKLPPIMHGGGKRSLGGELTLVTVGECQPSGLEQLPPDAIRSLSRPSESIGDSAVIAELFVERADLLDHDVPGDARSGALYERWRDLVGPVTTIPFDKAERRRVFADAYERLAPEIARHEAWGLPPQPSATDA